MSPERGCFEIPVQGVLEVDISFCVQSKLTSKLCIQIKIMEQFFVENCKQLRNSMTPSLCTKMLTMQARLINQRPRAAAPSAYSSRLIGQGHAAPDGSSPAAASGPAPQPQSHGPAQGTSAASDNNVFSYCIIAEDNNSYHNWDAGLQFLSDKEISGKLFELRDFTFTSALPVGKDRTKFASCRKKSWSLLIFFRTRLERVTPCGI